jgi:hypothetical protein
MHAVLQRHNGMATNPRKVAVKVRIVEFYDLDAPEIDRVFRAVLDHLTEGLFIVERGDTLRNSSRPKPGLYRVIDMQGHGSDVDELVTENLDDPQYAVAVAALRLEALLKDKKVLWVPYGRG